MNHFRGKHGDVVCLSLAGLVFLCFGGFRPEPVAAQTGTVLWQFTAGSAMDGAPAVRGDGIVYAGSDDNHLYAVQTDGVLKWRFQTGGAVFSAPAIASDGTVYIGSDDGFLYAVNADGSLRWKYPTNGMVRSSPAIGPDGIIYVGSNDGGLYAVTEAGVRQWRYGCGDAVRSSPAFDAAGRIYFGADDDHIYALTSQGALQWRLLTGGDVASSPAIGSDGTVYAGSGDGFLWAVTADGERKWRFETGGPVESSPVIGADGTLYVGSNDGNLYAVTDDGERGIEQWRFAAKGSVAAAPVMGADDIVYVAGADGVLYAIGGSGAIEWRVTLSETRSSPVVAPDGTLYVGSRGTGTQGTRIGRLYAVETDSDGIAHDAPWPVWGHDIRHTRRNTPNQAPTANAGEDQTRTDGERVALDGSGSTDPDYGIAAYRWVQTDGASVELTDSTAVRPEFNAPETEDETALVFQLTVTDNGGLTNTDSVRVTVEEDDSFCFIRSAARFKGIRGDSFGRPAPPVFPFGAEGF